MNLTTVEAVKAYLGSAANGQDTLSASLIVRASEYIQRYCGKEFPSKVHSGVRLNGTGSERMVLPGTPIVNVSSVEVGSVTLQASADAFTDPGYAHDDLCIWQIALGKFPMGFRNVKVSWVSGYRDDYDATVPSGSSPAIIPARVGRAAEDISCTYANGTAMSSVANAPTAGQYVFNGTAGSYTFNSGDSGQDVTLSYYYIPGAVEQAAIEMVALKLKQRDNIGIRSKSLAQESITYEDKDMTPSIKSMLSTYVTRALV